MSTIKINGINYTGNNIVVYKYKVIIDGKDLTPDSKEIKINVEGNISELKVDVCDTVSVNGNVGSIKTLSGDVEVTGDVNGGIQTMSGDIECYNVSGSVSTMSGDVKHRLS